MPQSWHLQYIVLHRSYNTILAAVPTGLHFFFSISALDICYSRYIMEIIKIGNGD